MALAALGRTAWVGMSAGMALAGLLVASLSGFVGAEPATTEADGLYVVDCLLPGQVRRLGNSTYMTPRRPVRTTVTDCSIRGGEYTAWDRADYRTALKVWLPAAEAGDPQAMTHVGEIFEQGLGTDPNYEIAFLWYERAARTGYKAAQVNLATLYETGRGVPRDPVAAINWYRKAWGVPAEEQLLSRATVEDQLADQEARLAAVEAEKATLAQIAEVAQSTVVRQAEQTAALASRVEELSAENDSLLGLLDEMPAAGSRRVEPQMVVLGRPIAAVRDGRNFGRFFALVVGNGSHEYLGDLETPPSDAERISTLLAERYGFQVTRIDNADDVAILSALNRLHDQLKPDDNLLIYYAGYGNARRDGDFEVGYWLPVNAERPPVDTYWLPVAQVGAHLARLPARRVLVMVDSSFAGMLADTPGFFFAMNPELFQSDRYIDLRFDNRSRLLISSGRDFPVESGDSSLSAFARGLLGVLGENDRILPAPALFLELRQELKSETAALEPSFRAIKGAGDAVGDFYFVPQS